MPPVSLADHLRPFALVVVRAFIFTWLAMVIGGVALAVAAGYWMPNVAPVARTLLQVFFALQFIVVGVVIAGRSALAAALIGGVRRMQLGKMGLKLLMGRMGAPEPSTGDDDPDIIDSPSSRPSGDTTISAIAASERLQQVLAVLAMSGGSRRGGVFGWLRGALLSAVGSITLSRFKSKASRAEKVNLASVERELEDQIDGLLLTRLRYTLFAWTAMVVAVLVVEVVGLTLLANALAS